MNDKIKLIRTIKNRNTVNRRGVIIINCTGIMSKLRSRELATSSFGRNELPPEVTLLDLTSYAIPDNNLGEMRGPNFSTPEAEESEKGRHEGQIFPAKE